MTKAAFDKIAEGLTEALEIARGTAEPRRLYVPPEIDVRAIRAKAGMTQERFASAFGFTVHQIRQWEQGRCRPLEAMRAYLMLIERDPQAASDCLHARNLEAEKNLIERAMAEALETEVILARFGQPQKLGAAKSPSRRTAKSVRAARRRAAAERAHPSR